MNRHVKLVRMNYPAWGILTTAWGVLVLYWSLWLGANSTGDAGRYLWLYLGAPLGVGVLVGGTLVTLRFDCQLLIDGQSFTIASKGLRGSEQHTCRLGEFDGVEQSGSRSRVVLTDGRSFFLPPGFGREADIVEALLKTYQEHSLRMGVPPTEVEFPPQEQWPWAFSNERGGGGGPGVDGEAIIDDPGELRSLIHRYRASVLFREAFPAAHSFARMFIKLRRTNGGLVLFGVEADGTMIGLSEDDLQRARERLEHLAADLTEARVEVGRIELDGKVALFAVFNLIPSHTRPLERYGAATSDVSVV